MCASAFRKRHDDIPVIWCGDFNSQPQGCVHQYLTKGMVNAKAAAPWYSHSRQRSEQQHVKTSSMDEGDQNLCDQFDRLKMTEEMAKNTKPNKTPKVRYLLDFNLNRFCRWLRILGIDAALETEQEEKERTRHGKM